MKIIATSISKSHLSLCVILLTLLFIWIIIPVTFSLSYNIVVFTLYLISLYIYIEKKKFDNYLDFEPIFVIIATIMIYTFPLLVFSDETAYLFSFHKKYSLQYINKGTVISTIALVSFFLGNLSQIEIRKINPFHYAYINNQLLLALSLSCYLMYWLLGGFEKYRLIYLSNAETGGITNYIEPILVALIQVIAFNELWNKASNKEYKISKICMVFVVLVALQFLLVGARTIASYLLLPIISFYTFRFKPISFVKMLFFIVLSIFSMNFLQSYRSGYDTSLVLEWYYKLTDLLIPNTNTYLALEIVDKQGISYGLTSLSSILLLIPFAQYYVQSVFDLSRNVLNSSDVFTIYLDTTAGMGTNFIAELYLAFGIVGVIFCSFLFGYILVSFKKKQFKSYYHSLALFVICGFSVYLVRSGLFYMFRFVVYALFFSALNLSIFSKYKLKDAD